MARFLIDREGDVIAPDGYCEKLSAAVRALVIVAKPKLKRRRISFVSAFLNDTQHDGSDDYRFADEGCEEAVKRVSTHFASFGLIVTSCQNGADPDRLDVRRPGGPVNHLAELASTLRHLYREFHRVGLRGPHNPLEIDGWHARTDEERRAWFNARRKVGQEERSYLHAGSRYRFVGRKTYPALIQDCIGVGQAIIQALRASDAEPTAVELLQVMSDSGQRYEDVHAASARGWWASRFDDWFIGRNKGGGVSLIKPIAMSSGSQAFLTKSMEERPHPERADASMMDYLRERGAIGDLASLELVLLFPNPKGKPYPYTTLLGILQRACAIAGVEVETDLGMKKPGTSHFRRSYYTEELEDVYATATTDEEIRERSLKIGEDLGHKTDQSERYAGKVKRKGAIARQRGRMERRKADIARVKAGLTPLARSKPLRSETGEASWLQLPTRGANP